MVAADSMPTELVRRRLPRQILGSGRESTAQDRQHLVSEDPPFGMHWRRPQ